MDIVFLRIGADGSVAADFGELPDRRRHMHRRPGGRGRFIFDDFLSPPLLRAYDGLLVDAVGNLWVKECLMGRETPPGGARWWVFDSTGVLRAAVRMPPVEIRQTEENPGMTSERGTAIWR